MTDAVIAAVHAVDAAAFPTEEEAHGGRGSRLGIRPGFEVLDEAMTALVQDGSTALPKGMIHYPGTLGV
ncbi:hypothetical protein ACWGI8_12275 [Streptomyces sp. NPDC054841]